MKYITGIILSLIILAACSKQDSIGDTQFIFGSYAGECIGNCAQFYKLEDAFLYPDDMSYFTHTLEEFEFQSTALASTKYELAESFYQELPDQLIAAGSKTFGTPDAYDQGGYFIVLIEDSDTLSWNIDTNRDVLPDYLSEYMDKLQTLLQQL